MNNSNLSLRLIHLLRGMKIPIPRKTLLIKFLSKRISCKTENFLCPTIHGFKLFIDRTQKQGLELNLFEKGTYEQGTLYLFKKFLRKGDCVVDIGANIGLMTLFAATRIGKPGKVLAFEPDQNNLKRLNKNIEINNFKNISTFGVALGSEEQTTDIYKVSLNHGSSTLLKPTEYISKQKANVTLLDNFIEKNPTKINLIKIDVEGWELEVLLGGKKTIRKCKPIICIEYSQLHPIKGGSLECLYDYIFNFGFYRIYKLEKGKEIPSKLVEIINKSDLPKHDNLICLTEEHIKHLKLEKIIL